MSPEQLAGEDADVRSDLYSLSLVLYRVLAGRPAFTSAERAKAPDPYAIPNLPFDLRHALRIGLAPSPRDRYASAIELEAAFDAAFEGRLDPALRARAKAQ
jgi:serine/threonine-protein kinase